MRESKPSKRPMVKPRTDKTASTTPHTSFSSTRTNPLSTSANNQTSSTPQEEDDFDRTYYDQEESLIGGGFEDDDDDAARWRKKEAERALMIQRGLIGPPKAAHLSAFKSALAKDQDALEDSLHERVGMGMGRRDFSSLDEGMDEKCNLIVTKVDPPFLDGRIAFTTQLEVVSVVRDPASDIAMLAKNGSQVIKNLRHSKDRNKSKVKFWELGG